jgi:hypothetical protein
MVPVRWTEVSGVQSRRNQSNTEKKVQGKRLGTVAHPYNPRFLGGGHWEAKIRRTAV